MKYSIVFARFFLIFFSITASNTFLAKNFERTTPGVFGLFRTASPRPQTPPVAIPAAPRAVPNNAINPQRLAEYRQFAAHMERDFERFNRGEEPSENDFAVQFFSSLIRNRLTAIASQNAAHNQAPLNPPVVLPINNRPTFNNNFLRLRLQEISGKRALPKATNDTLHNIKKRYAFGPHMLCINGSSEPIWRRL